MGRVVARYEYTNVKGEPRLRKRRWDPKDFDMQSWVEGATGHNFWASGIRPNRLEWSTRALYRLPEVVAALRVDVPTWWCEGEKDADNLAGLGLTATSTWQGASDLWPDQAMWFAQYRSRSEVLIVVDNDLPGGWFGWERFRTLTELVGVDRSRVHVLAPKWGWGKDVSDWLAKGRRPSDMRVVDLGRLRECAERVEAQRAARRYTFRPGSPAPGQVVGHEATPAREKNTGVASDINQNNERPDRGQRRGLKGGTS